MESEQEREATRGVDVIGDMDEHGSCLVDPIDHLGEVQGRHTRGEGRASLIGSTRPLIRPFTTRRRAFR